jgi:hypothetical protein
LSALAALLILQVALSVASVEADIVSPVLAAVFVWPGPLAVFSGRWMLIDV